LEAFLRHTPFIDFDHAAVQAFVEQNSAAGSPVPEQAITLYYAVRDQIRYDPYTVSPDPAEYAASHTLETGRGWCVTKAILYAACCRAVGVPAGLGYADVRNHMSTSNLRRLMGTDIFYWHGYTNVYLHDKWVKATPAFNVELCNKFRLEPLSFDGLEDSIYQPFDLDGKKHMEYLNYHGDFEDLPFDQMISDFDRLYPGFANVRRQGNFEKELDIELGS